MFRLAKKATSPATSYPTPPPPGAPPIPLWRNHLVSIVESYRFEMFIIGCLVVDCWCIFVEILEFEGGLNEEKEWVENMVKVAEGTSKTIIVLFVVDTIAHILALGLKKYCSNKMYILDGVVVLTTFILEFIIRPIVTIEHREFGLEEEGEAEVEPEVEPKEGEQDNTAETLTKAAIAIVTLFRSWRIIRLVHGLAFSEKLRKDKELKVAEEILIGKRPGSNRVDEMRTTGGSEGEGAVELTTTATVDDATKYSQEIAFLKITVDRLEAELEEAKEGMRKKEEAMKGAKKREKLKAMLGKKNTNTV